MASLTFLFLLIVYFSEVDRASKLNHSTCTKNANVKVSHARELGRTKPLQSLSVNTHLALELFCIANTKIFSIV